MTIKADLKEAVFSLWFSKQRTLLAIIGITIGIGSVIGMVSIGKIIQKEAMKQFLAMGTDLLTLTRFSQNSRDSDRILIQDVNTMELAIPSVKELAPNIQAQGQPTYKGKNIERGSVIGVTQPFIDINKLEIVEGRSLSDLDRLSFYAVVGHSVAKFMKKHGKKDLIGEKIKIGDRLFSVIGVLENSTNENLNFEPNHSILTHLTTQIRLDKNLEIQNIKIRIDPNAEHQNEIKKIQEYFLNKKSISDIEVRSPQELIKQMDEQMELYTMLLGAIGSISLIVGGVGVMNVMLVSVTERKKEIGVRRALGAKRRNIKAQFLIESTALSMLGGAAGIILGIAVAYFVAQYGKWEFVISEFAIILGFGVSSMVGMFFGYYPASQAAKLDPIVALRSD